MASYFVMLNIFKPGAHGQRPRAPGFLKLLLISLHVVMCVCPPTRLLITSGVIWCDLHCVWLVKQVLWLYPAFNYFIRHLPSIKWMGVTILTQHIVNAFQRKLRWRGTSYKRTTRKTERFIYKSEWANA